MKPKLLLLTLLLAVPTIIFSQEPTKTETQDFIKSKLSYSEFDVFRNSLNHTRRYEFDANCKLIIYNEFDENSSDRLAHIKTKVTIDVADIADVVEENGMLTVNFKSNSKQDYNLHTNLSTQHTEVTQNTFVNFHTFIFDSLTSQETIARLAKAFKHLSKLCGNKSNFDLFK